MKKTYPITLPDITDYKMLGEDIASMLESQSSRFLFSVLDLEGAPAFDLARELLMYLDRESENDGSGLRAIPVSSATNGLVAVLNGLGVGGKEVVTTSFNYPGVTNAIVRAGGIPRFVDVDPDTFCMDVSKLKGAVSKKTGAAIVSHLNMVVDVAAIAKEIGSDIPIIEDAALALTSKFEGNLPGTSKFSTATIFSFLATKAVSGLGGGMVVCKDEALTADIHSYVSQGRDFSSPKRTAMYGANYKLNEISALIALKQLKRIDNIVAWRKNLAELYDKHLKSLLSGNGVKLQKRGDETTVSHYAIRFPDRDRHTTMLWEKHGIMTGIWNVAHTQDIYEKTFGSVSLPVTEELANDFMFLPFLHTMEEKDVEFICEKLAECL